MNAINIQCVVSHIIFHVPSAHAMVVFPRVSLVSCLACSEKMWRDFRLCRCSTTMNTNTGKKVKVVFI